MKKNIPILLFLIVVALYPYQALKTNDFNRIKTIRNENFNKDSFIVGDSRLRNLALPNYQNLSIAGIGIPEIYFVCHSLFQKKEKINKLIICIDPGHLYSYNHFEVLQRDNFLTNNENEQIKKEAIELNDSLYIIKERSMIENLRFYGLIGEITSLIRMPIYILKDFKEYYLGSTADYLCHKEAYRKPVEIDDEHWNVVNPSAMNNRYGKLLFSLLKQHPETKVVWVIPSRHGGYNKDFSPRLKQWISQMGGNPLFYDMSTIITDQDFHDQKHLNCDGLIKLTSQLVML